MWPTKVTFPIFSLHSCLAVMSLDLRSELKSSPQKSAMVLSLYSVAQWGIEVSRAAFYSQS